MKYIQRKDGKYIETVDEFETRKEAEIREKFLKSGKGREFLKDKVK